MSNSFGMPWTTACHAPLSMGLPRQEYWNGLSFPSPRYLPHPGIKSTSPALVGGFFTTELPGVPRDPVYLNNILRKTTHDGCINQKSDPITEMRRIYKFIFYLGGIICPSNRQISIAIHMKRYQPSFKTGEMQITSKLISDDSYTRPAISEHLITC